MSADETEYEIRSEGGLVLARDTNYDELEWIAQDYRERGWKVRIQSASTPAPGRDHQSVRRTNSG